MTQNGEINVHAVYHSTKAIKMKKYSNKELQELVDVDLIWPKKGSIYHDKMNHELELLKKTDDWEAYINDTGVDLVHEELWWDCCEIINDLAQLVLDEREKTKRIISELKQTLKDTITDINKLK